MRNQIIRKIHQKLIQSSKTVAVAESCTGGQLSWYLTALAGSSAYFLFGAVVYSNRAKNKILGVAASLIQKHGAVSSQVAASMARKVREKSGADFGLSVTGIAGPGGATAAKPVGTVYIGLSFKNKNICRKFIFRGSRASVRNQSTTEALNLLCAHLPR